MSEPFAASRRAIVSGTSSGIGRAVAERLLHDGWAVTGFDRAESSIDRPLFEPRTIDLSDVEALRQSLQDVAAPDAVVHAAGHMRVGALGALNVADGFAMWATHIGAATVFADALAPRMRDGGRIVLIGSRAASGVAQRSQYAAVKAALVGLARSGRSNSRRAASPSTSWRRRRPIRRFSMTRSAPAPRRRNRRLAVS